MILKHVGWGFVVFGSILMSNFWRVHCTQVSDSGPHGPLVIRPTCRDVLWYGAGFCLSVCLSVRLSTKLVNTIQTEPFQLGPSNLVHLLLMTRGQILLFFKVRGQSHTIDIVVKPCKHDTDWTVSARTIKLDIHTTKTRGRHLSISKARSQRSRSHSIKYW